MSEKKNRKVVLGEFVSILKNLKESKGSLRQASIFFIEHEPLYRDMFSMLLKAMVHPREGSRRIRFLYLIDVVVLRAAKSGSSQFLELVGEKAEVLFSFPGTTIAELKMDDQGTERFFLQVGKIVAKWREKRIFNREVTDRLRESIIAIVAEIDALESPDETRRNKKKRKSILSKGSVLSEGDAVEVSRELLRHQRDSKKIRMEQNLRPENEDPMAEFDELWDEVENEAAPKYDNTDEAGSQFYTPSESPFTPTLT